MNDNDGDAAIDFALRLRTLHLDACKLLADLDRHDFDWQGPFWIPAAQCRTVLRLSAIRALLRASDSIAGPAFRHEIAVEAAKAGAVTP